MNKGLFFTFAVATMLFFGTAYATDFRIDIRSITVSPSNPVVGDTLKINTELYITGPSDPKVKLFLYVDGNLMETFIDYFDLGTQRHTFDVDTHGMYSGRKDIVVEAEVYDDDVLTDTGTYRVDIFLKDVSGISRAHDLTITQISYKNPVLSAEKFPVTVFVKNTGSLEERDVRIIVRLGSEVERSESFNVKRGDTIARTIYIRAPAASGSYNIVMEAENRAFNKVESKLDVVSTSLTLGYIPSSAALEEWVTVSGYALTGTGRPAQAVSVYKDGQYYASIAPDKSGYYSTSLRFFNVGSHSVAVRLGDIERYALISIVAPSQKPQVYFMPVAQPGETVIVVRDGQVRTYYGGTFTYIQNITLPATTPNASGGVSGNATSIAPYVSVTPAAKEVYSDKYKANMLYIDIENHLGRAGVFGVKTDFNPSIVFMPKPVVINDGEAGSLAVIFNPAEGTNGTISGNFVVYEGDTIVKTFPASLFVVQKKEMPAASAFRIPSMAADAFVALALIAIAAYAVLHSRKERRPLEPKIMPFGADISTKTRASAPMQRKIKSGGIFRVPWENVIY